MTGKDSYLTFRYFDSYRNIILAITAIRRKRTMAKKESMKKMMEMMSSFCGDKTGEDWKKMMDRCAHMMKPASQGKEDGEPGMKEFSSCCASFMKHCCFPMAEGKTTQADEAQKE
jgi:hypothetical protein